MSPAVRVATNLFLLAGLAACGGKPADAEPAAPTADVEVAPAVVHRFEAIVVAYGTADFSATASSTVPVTVESQVEALLTRAGAAVKRGQPLIRLVASPATRLDLDKARRDARFADSEVVRLRRLRETGLATQSELETAINTAGTAANLRDSLVARVGTGGHRTLLAPRDGIVDVLSVQPGDVLAAGTVAVRVASKDALKIRLGLEPVDVGRVRIGQLVRLVTVDGRATALDGRVDDLDLRIDPLTRQATAVVRAVGTGGVLPGSAMQGGIVVDVHADAVAVPADALLIVDDAAHLFVDVDGKAQQRPVKAGLRNGALVEITDGLKAGESVVTAGAAVLEDGMAVTTAANADAKPDAAQPAAAPKP